MRTHRKEKIGSVIQQVVGGAIAHRLHDPRIAPFATVTRVDVSGDLAIANVYLSVQGDEASERRTLSAVRHARGFLQREVARELSVRHCPELRFDIDRVAKGVRRTMALLDENRRQQPELFECLDTEANGAVTDTAEGDEEGNRPPVTDGAGE